MLPQLQAHVDLWERKVLLFNVEFVLLLATVLLNVGLETVVENFDRGLLISPTELFDGPLFRIFPRLVVGCINAESCD